MGNGEVVRPHEWQRMTAGTGVRHSEMNASKTEPVHFFQIWIVPEARDIKPGYEQRLFAPEEKSGRLRLVASRDGRGGSLRIHQDVSVYNALLKGGEAVELNGTKLAAGDGAAVSDESALAIRAVDDGEVIVFDLA